MTNARRSTGACALRAAVLAFAYSTVVPATADAAEPTPISVLLSARSPDGRVRATLQSGGAAGDGGWSYTITWRGPRVSRSIMLSSIIRQPLELHVDAASNRATVVGWATGTGVSTFDVVDIAGGTLLAEVPCYQPAVSPTGGSIAFVQWFAPRLTNLARKSAIYRIAEIARVAKEPGPGLIQQFAGTIVYPTSSLTISPDSPTTDTAQIHMMVGKFRWAGDALVSFDDLYRNGASHVHVRIARPGRYSVVVSAR